MRAEQGWTWLGLALGTFALLPPGLARADTSEQGGGCPVTRPNDNGYASQNVQLRHGNEWLATSIYPDGKVTFRPGGSGCIDENGALWVKWPWWRKVSGSLDIETGRLDRVAMVIPAFRSPGSAFLVPDAGE